MRILTLILGVFIGVLANQALANKQINCIADAVYHESRGEPIKCQYKVANVIINRVNHERWNNTACGVVYEKGQFSWVSRKLKVKNTDSYKIALKIAKDVYTKSVHDTTHKSTYFTRGVRFKNTVQVDSCGSHKFYRLKNETNKL